MLYTDNPKIQYDSKYDIMNYAIGDTSNSYGDEDIDNIVILKDFNTHMVTGYTIINFKRICKEHSEEYAIIEKLLDIRKAMQLCGIS